MKRKLWPTGGLSFCKDDGGVLTTGSRCLHRLFGSDFDRGPVSRICLLDLIVLDAVLDIAHAENLCVAFSPTDDHVLACGWRNKLSLWSRDGRRVHDFPIPKENTYGKVAWCSDGRRFAGYGKTVEIWNIDSREAWPMSQPKPYDMDWSPNGDQLAMARGGEGVLLWNPSQNTEQWIRTEPSARRIAWDRQGRRLAVGGNRRVTIINSSGETLAILPRVAGEHISHVAWHRDGQRSIMRPLSGCSRPIGPLAKYSIASATAAMASSAAP